MKLDGRKTNDFGLKKTLRSATKGLASTSVKAQEMNCLETNRGRIKNRTLRMSGPLPPQRKGKSYSRSQLRSLE